VLLRSTGTELGQGVLRTLRLCPYMGIVATMDVAQAHGAPEVKCSYTKRKNKRMFKGPEYEDPEYLDYIRSLPCAVSSTYGCKGQKEAKLLAEAA